MNSHEQYRVLTIFQSQKQNGLYSFGVMSIFKGSKYGDIKRLSVLNTFNELKTRADLSIYLENLKKLVKIDKVVTNIQNYSVDAIYYPTLTDAKTEHRLANGYKDVQSKLRYKNGILDHRNIKIDDSSEQIRYRFDFDTTKPIIYCICMALDCVKRDKVRNILRALKE